MSTHDAEEDRAQRRPSASGSTATWSPATRRGSRSTTAASCSATGSGRGSGCIDGRWAFLDDHLDRLFEAARAIDLDIGLRPRRRRRGAGGDARGERHGDRRPRPADGDPRPQGAAVPASAAVALRPDDGDHHGAFGQVRRAGAGRAARHRAAGPRAADEPGPQAQQPLQAQLRARLHPGREGRRRRGADARPARLRQHHQRLQLLHRPRAARSGPRPATTACPASPGRR